MADVSTTVCGDLVNSALLEEGLPGRLMMHQVVYDFAALKLSSEYQADAASVARRMVAAYLALAKEGSSLTGDAFDVEYQNLVAALDIAISKNMGAEAIRLMDDLYPALEKRGVYSIAKPYLENVRHIAKAQGNERAEIQALLRLGNVCLEVGDLTEGRRHLEAGVDLASGTGFAGDVADLLSKLGWASGMRGDLDSASTYFSDALTLSTEKRTAQALQGLGWVAGLQGRHIESDQLLHRAVELARGLQDDALVADLLQVRGWMNILAGDYVDAHQTFEECLNLSRQHSLKSVEVDALHGLGVVESKEGRYGVARELLSAALDLATQISYHERVPIMRHLAAVDRELGLLDEAETFLSDALRDARQQNRPEKLAQVLAEQGLLMIQRGDLVAAEAAFSESLAFAEGMNVGAPRAWALRGLAMLRIQSSDFDQARELLMRALRLEAGNPSMTALLRQDVGELELLQGRYEDASRTFIAVRSGAVRTGQRELAALASYGLARSVLMLDDRSDAQRFGEESVSELAQIESPRLGLVTAWLSSLNQ